jgi:Meckel syndrome type 1 protein
MRWPTIVVQINSLDAWDRFRIEGYGFFELPRTVGTHHLEIKTYKPLQSVDTQQYQFFVGRIIFFC